MAVSSGVVGPILAVGLLCACHDTSGEPRRDRAWLLERLAELAQCEVRPDSLGCRPATALNEPCGPGQPPVSYIRQGDGDLLVRSRGRCRWLSAVESEMRCPEGASPHRMGWEPSKHLAAMIGLECRLDEGTSLRKGADACEFYSFPPVVHGQALYWSGDGRLAAAGAHHQGERVGRWLGWDSTGNLSYAECSVAVETKPGCTVGAIAWRSAQPKLALGCDCPLPPKAMRNPECAPRGE